MIVASEHVLGAQIHKGQKVHASDLGNIALVTLGDAMSMGQGEREKVQEQRADDPPQVTGGDADVKAFSHRRFETEKTYILQLLRMADVEATRKG